MLWYDLKIGAELIGEVEIQRMQRLDLSDPEAIQDVISPYRVRVNRVVIGVVRHRYGDGAWVLNALAADLIQKNMTVAAAKKDGDD